MLLRSSLAVLMIAVGCTATMAQTEGERRRAHLPFVRAATDCIARSIAANDAALGHAAAGRWGDAFNAVFEVCRPQLLQMVNTHDQIYGGGGLDFYRGAYQSDLPRALSTRLRADIERRTVRMAEQERREREALAAREQAAKQREEAQLAVMGEAFKVYNECLVREAATIAPFSNEGAETIAIVAETKCRSERERMSNLAQALFANPAAARTLATDLAEDARRKLVAGIVTIRAEAEAARVRGLQPSPSAPVQAIPAAPGRTF